MDCVLKEVPGFTFTFDGSDKALRFAYCIPYQLSHFEEWCLANKDQACLEIKKFCETKAGRNAPYARINASAKLAKYCLILTARHHACESTANYVLEALLSTALEDSKTGKFLRDNVEIFAIPFMDLDGVEAGDQGKNRKPHDHNRDYVKGIYPETMKLRNRFKDWSKGRDTLVFDLHCPWIRGGSNEYFYFVGGPAIENWKRVAAFSEILEKNQSADLNYKASDNMPFGESWNTHNDPELMSCGRWAEQQENLKLGTTIEIPYANTKEKVLLPDDVRSFGTDLAKAIALYLA